ncbi:fibronectin type III domain-containing protein [Chengkuizengella marina]|uniref:CBM56 domain-containing protein n=1 Tax=Chengkuizengella marina TaxID=2507566 RepID=A0A6N9Q1Z3_9BACL|nr:hypothetical protein [Chengkuizengella marina]NBI29063.1 hypothetical protein [Chengkuizengella marina]
MFTSLFKKKMVIFLTSFMIIVVNISPSLATETIEIQAPTNLQTSISTDLEYSKVVLNWDYSDLSNIDHFNVYSSVDLNAIRLHAAYPTTTEFIDPQGVYANTTRYYYVTAVDVNGNESEPSNIATFNAGNYTNPGNIYIGWSKVDPDAGAYWVSQGYQADYVIMHYTKDGVQQNVKMPNVGGGAWMLSFDDIHELSDVSFTWHYLGFQYDSE